MINETSHVAIARAKMLILYEILLEESDEIIISSRKMYPRRL